MKSWACVLCPVIFVALSWASQAALYTVTNAADAATEGTLRWAIEKANSEPEPNKIEFDLPPPYVITVTGAMLEVTGAHPLVIDGESQPGFADEPIVQLVGTNTTAAAAAGLVLRSDGNTVRGLVFRNFKVVGVVFEASELNTLDNCWILRNGFEALGDGLGVLVNGGGYHTIGAAPAGSSVGNVISSNSHHGLALMSSSNNWVSGNRIGTDPSGTESWGNGTCGIWIRAAHNTIGGTNARTRNVISGNGDGIRITEGLARDNVIAGNYIGTTADGMSALPYQYHGVKIEDAPNNHLTGKFGDEGLRPNVISGNRVGVYISGSGAVSNSVDGNLIGTDAVMSNALPNTEGGIHIQSGAHTRIGVEAFNAISGNGGVGLYAADNGHRIENNIIGFGAGFRVLSNQVGGIWIAGSDCRVGGMGGLYVGGPNMIGPNGDFGVKVTGTNNTIFGNTIFGTDITLTNVGGLSRDGVIVSGGVSNVVDDNTIVAQARYGVFVEGQARNNEFIGNRIGVMDTNIAPNYAGVVIDLGSDNVVERNTISANPGGAVWVRSVAGVSSGNIIVQNFIGTGTNGLALAGEPVDGPGILVWNSPGTGVGGNVVVGHREGVRVLDAGSTGTVIAGNAIGINMDSEPLGNGGVGIELLNAAHVLVGGTNRSEYNSIGACDIGILISGAACRSNRVYGNLVGGHPDYLQTWGNHRAGIWITDGASYNRIGDDPLMGRGNVVMATTNGPGIWINDGAEYNVVKGNGLFNNAGPGIELSALYATVGGRWPGELNVISGNEGAGLLVTGSGAKHGVIKGNIIGQNEYWPEMPGNGGGGVVFRFDASSMKFGGLLGGEGNIIAGNRQAGVVVVDTCEGIEISGNSIYDHPGLGIDLGGDGVTPNDMLDPDVGPNALQNYPEIEFAKNDPGLGTLTIAGWLNSKPFNGFRIEYFANAQPNLSGYGEGKAFMGYAHVTSDINGRAVFTNTFAIPTPVPNFVALTATDTNLHNTSEFTARFMLDLDDDGMADGYEMENFGSITGGEPNVDVDNDGATNLDEFVADTDPADSLSVLRCTISREDSNAVVRFHSSAYRIYDFHSSPIMPEWGWTTNTRHIAGTGAEIAAPDNLAVTGRLYRVQAMVP